MKDIPGSWKPYFLLLSVLVLVLTVVGDRYRAPSEPKDHDSGHSHRHDETHDHSGSPDSHQALDEAFNQAPDPGAATNDPEREHRMAIFHYNEGNKFLNRGNWKEAIDNYKMALHHDKALQEVYINMSNAYLKGRRYEEAKETLDSLKAQAPDNPHLYYNLACYYSLTHRQDASLKALQQSIRLGYKNIENVQSDPDLAPLRQTQEFQKWVKTL